MAQHGVQDDDGSFNNPTEEEIEQRIIDRARENLGEDADLSQSSPLKQLLDVGIEEHDYVWDLLEEIYYSAYYGHAYSEQLDKLMKMTQFTRIPRRGATGEVTFSVRAANESDVVIPEGTIVAAAETDERPQIPFMTSEPARLQAGHSQVSNVSIRAAEPWEVDRSEEWLGAETNVASNTITEFVTPIRGVDAVANPHPTGDQSREDGYVFQPGRDRETDREFRNRFERSFGAGATATIDGIRASLLSMTGIRNADVAENVEPDPDAEGRPGNCVHPTILGDAHENDVAQQIVETRSGGINTYGNAHGTAVTTDGVERIMYFDWAAEKSAHIEVSIQHTGDYPDDGSLRVEENIIQYVGGTTADQVDYPGTGMGETVVFDQVFNRAMDVPGVVRADVQMGIDSENLSTDDIVAAELESVMTDYQSVVISSTRLE